MPSEDKTDTGFALIPAIIIFFNCNNRTTALLWLGQGFPASIDLFFHLSLVGGQWLCFVVCDTSGLKIHTFQKNVGIKADTS